MPVFQDPHLKGKILAQILEHFAPTSIEQKKYFIANSKLIRFFNKSCNFICFGHKYDK